MKNFENHHAFVTGGASGIGLAIARALAAEGAKVSVADFDRERLATLADEFTCVELDVRDRERWLRAKGEAERANGQVAILVNNAGIAPQRAELADTDPAVFDRLMAINLTGVLDGVRTFAPAMRAAGKGHIVNVASMAGMVATPTLGAYTISKFGVVGLSEVLRAEMAPHGVGVSVFCPGQVSTGIAVSLAKVTGGDVTAAEAIDMPGLDPAKAAQVVLAGIRANDLYIFSHGENSGRILERLDAIRAAAQAAPDSASL